MITEELKSVIFRVPQSLKDSFRVALIHQDTDAQHLLEAFAEFFVDFDNGNTKSVSMSSIVARSRALMSPEENRT
jgi:hypothetical protein